MLAVLVSCMSASLLAVTLTEAELLAGTGSGSAVLIPAVLPSVPALLAVAVTAGVSVYTTLAPWATLELAAVLVMDTSAPEVDVTSADVVLLAVLPSGMAELSGLMPSMAKAAVTVPLTLDTAGTVSTEADAPLARVPVRVQVTLPLLSG